MFLILSQKTHKNVQLVTLLAIQSAKSYFHTHLQCPINLNFCFTNLN